MLVWEFSSVCFLYSIICDVSAQSQNWWPLLGSDSVNMIPQQPNYVTTAMDTHATIEELLEMVFSVRFICIRRRHWIGGTVVPPGTGFPFRCLLWGPGPPGWWSLESETIKYDQFWVRCEVVASQWGQNLSNPEAKESIRNCGSCCQAAHSKDIDGLVHAIVNCKVCKLVKWL
jgi:hypothetical protein